MLKCGVSVNTNSNPKQVWKRCKRTISSNECIPLWLAPNDPTSLPACRVLAADTKASLLFLVSVLYSQQTMHYPSVSEWMLTIMIQVYYEPFHLIIYYFYCNIYMLLHFAFVCWNWNYTKWRALGSIEWVAWKSSGRVGAAATPVLGEYKIIRNCRTQRILIIALLHNRLLILLRHAYKDCFLSFLRLQFVIRMKY